MSPEPVRRPRRIRATATHLNAGPWGSRFVGECEIVTNGERVWVMGPRVPVWVACARVFGYVGLIPAAFGAGVVLVETLLGRRGYPPYYHLAAALLTFLLVIIGLWMAGIWSRDLGTFDTVSWPVAKSTTPVQTKDKGRTWWTVSWADMKRFFNMTGLLEVEVPVGPGGRSRRLILKSRGTGAHSVAAVLSGDCRSRPGPEAGEEPSELDNWGWSRH